MSLTKLNNEIIIKILSYSIPTKSQPNFNSWINSYNSNNINNLSINNDETQNDLFKFKNKYWILQIDRYNLLYRYLLKYCLVCKDWNKNILPGLPIDRVTVTSVNSIRLFINLLKLIPFRSTFHLSVVISQQMNGNLVYHSKSYLESMSEGNLSNSDTVLFQYNNKSLVNIYQNQSMKNVFSFDFINYLEIIRLENLNNTNNSSPNSNNNDDNGNIGIFNKLLRNGTQVLKKELFESLIESTSKLVRSFKFYHDNWEGYYIGFINQIIKNNSLNSLDLSGNLLNDSSIKTVLESLKQIKTLSELNISRNQLSSEILNHFDQIFKSNLFLANINFNYNQITSHSMKSFLDSIKSNAFKKNIQFAFNRLDDLSGVLLCRFLLTNDTVTNVNLSSNQISYETVILLNDVLKQTKSLRKLNISCTTLDQGEAIAILSSLKVNSTLRYLSMVGCSIGSVPAQTLSEVLNLNSTLTSLDLRFNSSINPYGPKLMESFGKNSSLTYLNMGFCNLGYEAGISLGESLSTNQSLNTIIFNNNKIGEQGIIAICNGLLLNNTLKYLDLGSSFIDFELVGYNAGLALQELLKINQTLKALHLYNNKMGHETVQLIVSSLFSDGNTTLRELNISSNSIRVEGALAIARLILENKSLVHLNVNNSNIPAEGLMSILESLKLNSNLYYIGIAGNASSLLQLDILVKQLLSENQNLDQMDYAVRTPYRRFLQYEKQRSLFKSRKYLLKLYDMKSPLIVNSKEKLIFEYLKPIIFK